MDNHSPLRAKSNTPNSREASPSKSVKEAALDSQLQKQYADLFSKFNESVTEYAHLEEELGERDSVIMDLNQKIVNSEKLLRRMEEERHKITALYEREISFYKESIDKLQRRSQRMSQTFELDQVQIKAETEETEEKYRKLMRSYKALESNFELEQNSKALLIDQIEYLTKERDFLLQNSVAQITSVTDSDNSIIHHGDNNSDLSDSDGSVHGTHMLSAFVDDLESHDDFDSSSPIKDPSFHSDNSIEVSKGFLFPPLHPTPLSLAPTPIATDSHFVSPPLPDPKAKNIKRLSLPAQLKSLASPEEDDFVLSPLKLTLGPSSSYFDVSLSTPKSGTKKRYSSSKPTHSRYNSHDIVPIKVEFELLDHQLRSASAPDKELLRGLASVDENASVDDERDKAFMKLSGFEPLKRDSLLSNSSKRSSLLTDSNFLMGDVTKQEITKLKFELQSLKLHNEKLLSYIGFELQKQKKSIKKLLSKQNLRGNMEYSDAKLIEKLRNMLIHKKRVLRSVSINPVALQSENRRSGAFQAGVGIRALGEDDDDFIFRSSFLNVEDDFSTHKHHGHQKLENSNLVKKFKSQTFRPCVEYEDLDASFMEDDLLLDEDKRLPDEDEEEGWDTTSDNGSGSDVDYAHLTRFNQMKYLILGKEHMKKQKKAQRELLVDENLKYKFLTIVIGIVIVGIRFTTHPPLPHN